jgi:hypothetical protein
LSASLAATPLLLKVFDANAGASEWAVRRLSRLMLSAGSVHHTPWAFYLSNTGSGTAEVQQFGRRSD